MVRNPNILAPLFIKYTSWEKISGEDFKIIQKKRRKKIDRNEPGGLVEFESSVSQRQELELSCGREVRSSRTGPPTLVREAPGLGARMTRSRCVCEREKMCVCVCSPHPHRPEARKDVFETNE